MNGLGPWIELGTQGLATAGAWLAVAGVRTTVVLGVFLAAGHCFRNRAASELKAVYRCGLAATAGALLLSTAISPAPAFWAVPLPPTREATLAPPVDVPEGGRPSAARHAAEGACPESPAGAHPTRTNLDAPPSAATGEGGARTPVSARPGGASGLVLVGAIWLPVVLLLVFQDLRGMRAVRELRRRCTPSAAQELREAVSDLCRSRRMRSPELLEGAGVGSPLAVGLTRPAVLLPHSFLQDFNPEQRRAVLAHEVGHLAARDLPWSLVSRVLTCLLWFQPLLWVVSARLEQANEEAADTDALEAGCSRREYAEMLITLAERLVRPTAVPQSQGMAVVPLRSSVGRRIGRLFAAPTPLSGRRACGYRAGLAVAGLAATALSASLAALAAPPEPVSLEQARREVDLSLVEPRGLPAGAALKAVRVYPMRSYAPSPGTGVPAPIQKLYGISVRPDGKRVFIRSMPGSVAARSGIPAQEVELLSLGNQPLGGPFPKVPRASSQSSQPRGAMGFEPETRPTDAEARNLDALIRRFSQEPLRLNVAWGKKGARVFTLARREAVRRPPLISTRLPDKTAVMEFERGNKGFTLFQIPPSTRHHLLKALRPLKIVDDAAQLIDFKSAAREYLGKLEIWTLGPKEAPSVFWSAGGVDFWLENTEGALSRAEVLALVRANSGRLARLGGRGQG